MTTNMTTTKKLITAVLAATTLAVGSLAATGDAFAKGPGGPGWHGGYHNKWHGHRWHGRFFYNAGYGYDDSCYLVRKPSGKLVKICPFID